MLKIDFVKLKQEQFKEIIYALEAALEELNIDYYLIGAIARDIWFSQENITTRRTNDIDFAVLVPQRESFTELKTFLSKKKGYIETKGNSFTMLSPDGITVDILPFGSIEIDENLELKGDNISIVTNGFKEIYENALQLFEAEDHQLKIKIASIPGIVLLKLISYQDRPEIRGKDPQDILEIIEHYFDLYTEKIYEHHADLFDEEKSLEEIASRVIGREIRKIISSNNALMERIYVYLNQQIILEESSTFFGIMLRSNNKNTLKDLLKYISELQKGIFE